MMGGNSVAKMVSNETQTFAILSVSWSSCPPRTDPKIWFLSETKVGQIERVFVSACRQKAWDQFTKAQRKNIAQWKSQLAVSCVCQILTVQKPLLK
jgi:hypothetical protein